jgi:hypothetical protein
VNSRSNLSEDLKSMECARWIEEKGRGSILYNQPRPFRYPVRCCRCPIQRLIAGSTKYPRNCFGGVVLAQLDGSRSPDLWQDPSLTYFDAVELKLLLEQLAG